MADSKSENAGGSAPRGTESKSAEDIATQLSDSPDSESADDPAVKTPTAGFEAAQALLSEQKTGERTVLKDRFILDEKIGQGGMGSVYKARDLRKVEAEDRNPYVAIKILTADLGSDGDALITLQQEAVKTQALAHPNVLTVYDFDREDSTFFMTMELLKGDPLDQLLELEAPFSRALTLRYLRDLCAGLEYAHKRGLVHADFKPGNVFVTASGVAKILDFGIAQAIAKPLGKSRFSDNKVSALTPAYATCEMIAGEPPVASDDVYALACVLYYMLTGSHPYNMKSAEAVALEDLSPLQPDSLTEAEWAPLLRALSCDRAQRPDSVAAFRESVLAALADDAGQDSANNRRNRTIPLLLGGVAAVVVVGLLALYSTRYSGSEIGEQPSLAGDSASNTDEQPNVNEDSASNTDEQPSVTRESASNTNEQPSVTEDSTSNTDEQLESMLTKVEDCLAAEDLDCANESYQLAMGRAPGDERMAALGTRIQALQSEQNLRTISTLMEGGLSCQDQKNHACMVNRANAILKIDPQHPGARQLLSNAEDMKAAEAAKNRKSKRNIKIE